MTTMALPSVLLNITPAGLGIRESAITLVAAVFGFSVGNAFLAASLDRFLTLLVVFSVGLLTSLMVLHKFSKDSTIPEGVR